MDELQDVIPEDPDDCDDFAPDGSLGSMLEEYRKSKQEKQLKLEERAVRDGRPFSAPVASPSCDDIKKRQLDSRALKETPPGPAKLKRSTSEASPTAAQDLHTHISGEMDYPLAAVPEEATGAQKPEAGTSLQEEAPSSLDRTEQDSREVIEDDGADGEGRLRLEDMDELEQTSVQSSDAGQSEISQPEGSTNIAECLDEVLTEQSVEEIPMDASELHSTDMHVGYSQDGAAEQYVSSTQHVHAAHDEPENGLATHKSPFNTDDVDNVPVRVPDSDAGDEGDSLYAVHDALGHIMENAVSTEPPSTVASAPIGRISADQVGKQAASQLHSGGESDGSGLQLAGEGQAASCSPAPSIIIDRTLGSIISNVCAGTDSERCSDQIPSRSSLADQDTSFVNEEGKVVPPRALYPTLSREQNTNRGLDSTAQSEFQPGDETLKQIGGGGDQAGSTNQSNGPDSENFGAIQPSINQEFVRPSALQLQQCLQENSILGQRPGHSDTEMVADTQPSPFPRPQPCLPRMVSDMTSNPTLPPEQIAAESAPSPFPRPAPQLFPAASLSQGSTLNATLQSMAETTGAHHSGPLQDPHVNDRTQSTMDHAHPSSDPLQTVLSTGQNEMSNATTYDIDAHSEQDVTDGAAQAEEERADQIEVVEFNPSLPAAAQHLNLKATDRNTHTWDATLLSTLSLPTGYGPQGQNTGEHDCTTPVLGRPGSGPCEKAEPSLEADQLQDYDTAAPDQDGNFQEAGTAPQPEAGREDMCASETHEQSGFRSQAQVSIVKDDGKSSTLNCLHYPDEVDPESMPAALAGPATDAQNRDHSAAPDASQGEDVHAVRDVEDTALEPAHEEPLHDELAREKSAHEGLAAQDQVDSVALDDPAGENVHFTGHTTYSVNDNTQTGLEVSDMFESARFGSLHVVNTTAEEPEPIAAGPASHTLEGRRTNILRHSISINKSTIPITSAFGICPPSEDEQASSQVQEQPVPDKQETDLHTIQKGSDQTQIRVPPLSLPKETRSRLDSTTSQPPEALQPASAALPQHRSIDGCAQNRQPTGAAETEFGCTHCGARNPEPPSTLTSEDVLDRLALFACGRMGVEALLHGNVIAAIRQLLYAGTQDGVSLAAQILRRSVTLTVGQRAPSRSQASDTNYAVMEIIFQVVDLVSDAAKVPGLIPQLLEAKWDTVLTEIPRGPGPLYHKARVALQQLLHTEECLLSTVAGQLDHTNTATRAHVHHHPAQPDAAMTSSTRTRTGKNSVPPMPPFGQTMNYHTDQKEHFASRQQMYVAPTIVAACDCGRPVVLGAPETWETMPDRGHLHARRTVSGKTRARKGGTLSSSIQKHMEEAMQPDGADLEYVYLGPSKGMSNSSPVSPSHSPMYIAAYSMHPGTTFIQEDSSPYAPVDDWSVEPYPMAPGAFVSRTRRPAIAGSPRVPRPKTAGARLRTEWDDSPAGIPARTRSQDGPESRGDAEGTAARPGSAEPYIRNQTNNSRPTPGRGHAPHAWVGTYWDNELSPYVRQSFQQAQGALIAQQAAQSCTSWLRNQIDHEVLRNSGSWTNNSTFQAPTGTRFPSRAAGPTPGRPPQQQQQPQQQHREGWDARHAYNMQADDMQAVYTEQLNEMLRYANQCSVMLGSKYRYKAARRRPASAAAGRHRVATALEGCVERHVVTADGISTMQDPGMIKVMSCAKFMTLLEQLAVRVNGMRGLCGGKKKSAQSTKSRRRGVGASAR